MRGLIFDLDDTLYPHEAFVRSGLAAAARYAELRFGIPAAQSLRILLDGRRRTPGRELQALCAASGLSADTVPDLLAAFRAHVPAVSFFADAEPALRQLRADGWSLAVLTNGPAEVQAGKVRALEVDALVDHVVYAEEHAEGGKPAPAPFLETLRRLDLPASRCVMVGDDLERDMLGARLVGLRTIAVRRQAPAAASPLADATAESLGEVPALAGALLQKASFHAA